MRTGSAAFGVMKRQRIPERCVGGFPVWENGRIGASRKRRHSFLRTPSIWMFCPEM